MAKTIQLKVKGLIDNTFKVYETHRKDAVISETEETFLNNILMLRCNKSINGKRAYHESQITKELIIYAEPKALEELIDEMFDFGFKKFEK